MLKFIFPFLPHSNLNLNLLSYHFQQTNVYRFGRLLSLRWSEPKLYWGPHSPNPLGRRAPKANSNFHITGAVQSFYAFIFSNVCESRDSCQAGP